MPAIKSAADIAAKWSRKAPASIADYEAGVRDTTADWATLTSQAAPAYNTGIQASLSAKRWETNVKAAGTAQWKDQTLKKGPARWAEGVSLGGDAYQRGFGPMVDVIRNTVLPARGSRGSESNYNRSKIMGQALNKARVGK